MQRLAQACQARIDRVQRLIACRRQLPGGLCRRFKLTPEACVHGGEVTE